MSAALSWHASGTGIQMLPVPPEPATQTWPVETIAELSQNEALNAGDIDNDGQLDLLLGTKWLRRNDGMTNQAESLVTDVVDTTGAGDTFVGYFVAGVAAGISPECALARASLAAGLSVGRPGAMDSIPTAAEVNDLEAELARN